MALVWSSRAVVVHFREQVRVMDFPKNLSRTNEPVSQLVKSIEELGILTHFNYIKQAFFLFEHFGH